MPRCLSIALIATLCLAFTARAEDKPSPAVKRILEKAVLEVKKNRDDFAKANAKPLGEARQELQDLSTQLIKDGKTDEATAVLAHLKTLDADVMRMANAPAPMGGGSVPRKTLIERLAGKWEMTDEPLHVMIRANGDVETFRDSDGRLSSKGRIVVSSPEFIEVRWDNGFRNQYRLAGDDAVAVFEWNSEGKRTRGFSMERMK